MYLAPSLAPRPAVYSAPRLERRTRREVEMPLTGGEIFIIVVALAVLFALGAMAICLAAGGRFVWDVTIKWWEFKAYVSCVR